MNIIATYIKDIDHKILNREEESSVGKEIDTYRKEIISEISRIPKINEKINNCNELALNNFNEDSLELIEVDAPNIIFDNDLNASNPINNIKMITPSNMSWNSLEAVKSHLSASLDVIQNGDEEAAGNAILDIGVDVDTLQEVVTKVNELSVNLKEKQDFIVSHNLRLVMSRSKLLAKKTNTSFEDIIQNGNVGLIKAAEHFDWTTGNRFSTYAVYWVDMMARKAAYEQNGPIVIPSHYISLYGKINRIETELTNQLNRKPTIEELAKKVGMTTSRIRKIRNASISTISLDQPIGNDRNSSFISELIGDSKVKNPLMGETDPEKFIDQMINKTSEKEKEKLCKKYGFNSFPKDVDELRDVFNFTLVDEAEKSAIEKLRAMKDDKTYQFDEE